ncbi:MAG TPA: alpha-L-fucosidase, partial [Acidimicrobiales bacterium]|nr:alpha-L-fucosidase [Acidimicrobiales bacterium]
GGYDWPYNGAVLANPADAVLAVPQGEGYRRYAAGHVRELVDRYRPSVLWNDIGWPAGGNLPELFAHYYNSVEDGLVNDRWLESTLPRGRMADVVVRGLGQLVQRVWPLIPESRRALTFPPPRHYDVRTPEYSSTDRPPAGKWELTRGVGHSFGANRNERPEDLLSATELVRLFVDVVSKNGNLLIGVGPRPEGNVPDEQQEPLRGLGRWMEVNGEGVTGSRPWAIAEASAADGTPLRFTQRDGAVYAFLLAAPGTRSLVVPSLDAAGTPEARLLGSDEPLAATVEDGRLAVRLPERLPVSPAHGLRLTGGIRPARA